MDDDRPAINSAIRQLRKEYLGCSQTELAEALDVATDTVSRWERGKTEPSKLQRHFLMAIAVRSEAPEELINALAMGDGQDEKSSALLAPGLAAGVGAVAGGLLGPFGAVAGAIPGALAGATAVKLLGRGNSSPRVAPQIRRLRKQIRRSADYLGVEEGELREELLSILETAAGADWDVKTLIRALYALSNSSNERVEEE